jgi:ferredoxin/flavodoxin
MSTDIYYFSGTGNSLYAAKQLGNGHSDKVRIFPIPIFRHQKKTVVHSDIIIIVFPVYFQTLPSIVESFVNNVEFTSGISHIYGVATCNGEPGHSLFTLNRILKKKGISLKAGFTVVMPGNSIIIRDFTNPYDVRIRRLQEAKHRLKEISQFIHEKHSGGIEGNDGFKYHLQGFITGTVAKHIYKTPTRFRFTKNCSQCSLCIKLCPLNNITMGNEGPRWGNKCEHCLACFHWCPRIAIELGNSSHGKLRYHHPDILIQDMFFKS